MKFIKVFICIILLTCITNCKEKKTHDEEIFKQKAVELRDLLDKFFSIKVNTQIKNIPGNQSRLFIHDSKEREVFIKKNKEQWLNIDIALREFIIKYIQICS